MHTCMYMYARRFHPRLLHPRLLPAAGAQCALLTPRVVRAELW